MISIAGCNLIAPGTNRFKIEDITTALPNILEKTKYIFNQILDVTNAECNHCLRFHFALIRVREFC